MTIKEDFKVGDILRMNEESLRISWRQKRWRDARFKVISFLDEGDLDGRRIIRIERLNLPSHARQSWSQKFFIKSDDKLEVSGAQDR